MVACFLIYFISILLGKIITVQARQFGYTLMVTLLWLMSVCTANRLVRRPVQLAVSPQAQCRIYGSVTLKHRMKPQLFAHNNYPHGLGVSNNSLSQTCNVIGPYVDSQHTQTYTQTQTQTQPTQTHMYVNTHSSMHNIYSEQLVLLAISCLFPWEHREQMTFQQRQDHLSVMTKGFLCKWAHKMSHSARTK